MTSLNLTQLFVFLEVMLVPIQLSAVGTPANSFPSPLTPSQSYNLPNDKM